jgi:hypothetical protein
VVVYGPPLTLPSSWDLSMRALDFARELNSETESALILRDGHALNSEFRVARCRSEPLVSIDLGMDATFLNSGKTS